jgi:uncharacterized protein (DUF2336 family)
MSPGGSRTEDQRANDPGQDLQFLLDLALNKSLESRKTLTATIGELFSKRDKILTERERALMSEILSKLIRDCEMAVRRDLGERLSKAPNPPHDLMVALANDEIEVAETILMKSLVLRDVELIRIIRHRTQQHQLAIAMRRSISEHVSDALVETGNVDVIKTLIENADARISDATMEYLAEESRRVDTYQEPLLKREDLKPELAERMYLWVSAALRSYILENFEVEPSHLDDQLEGVAEAIARDSEQHRTEPDEQPPAEVLARRLVEQRRVTPDFLVQVLRQGEISLFEALFGALSKLKAPRLQSVLYDSGGEGLAIACRAMEMPKPTFATIFLLSRRGRPGKQIVNPRELSRALLLFDKMNPNAALEVMKGWRRDWRYQDAIERVAEPAEEPSTEGQETD